MTEKEIEVALKGQCDGTYGGSMKPVMKVQTNSIKKENIRLIAKYIYLL